MYGMYGARNKLNKSYEHNSLVKSEPEFIGEIKQEDTSDLFGILLFKQEMLDQIFKDSGSLAKHNEFQFHYTALIGTSVSQNQRLKVSIPLVCYNYKQTVSCAHVGFNLNDVEEMSDSILSIAQMNASKFKESEAYKDLVDLLDITDWEIATLQSMHRHPGRSSQGFSGTDLQDDPNKPGVVFPFDNSPEISTSFSSIMYIDNQSKCRLAHTEIRSVLGSTSDKDGILYSKGKSLTIVSGYDIEPTKFETMFGISGSSCSNTVYENDVNINEILQKTLLDIMSKSDFEPDIFIDSSYLSTKSNFHANQNINNIHDAKNKTKSVKTYGNSSENLFSKHNTHNVPNKRNIIDTYNHFDEYDDYNMYSNSTPNQSCINEVDALEQDGKGCYINNPETLDEFDQELLTESLREDLSSLISSISNLPVYSERTIALKPEKEIWRLARLNDILVTHRN